MPTNYPGALDTTSELPNNRSDNTGSRFNHPRDHNNLADAVLAIEGELGVNPSGTDATVAERIAAVQAAVALLDAQVPVLCGTADPATLSGLPDRYLYVQTGLGDGNDFEVWIELGA